MNNRIYIKHIDDAPNNTSVYKDGDKLFFDGNEARTNDKPDANMNGVNGSSPSVNMRLNNLHLRFCGE